MQSATPVAAVLHQLLAALACGCEFTEPSVLCTAKACDAYELLGTLLDRCEEVNGRLPFVAFAAEDVFEDILGLTLEELDIIAENRMQDIEEEEMQDLENAIEVISSTYGMHLSMSVPGTIVFRGVTFLPTIDLKPGCAEVVIPQAHIAA